MFFLIVILAGLAIGFATGGRLRNLGKLRLRWPWLVLGALLIQLLIFPSFAPEALIPFATAPLHVLSYVLLALWILVNARCLPILLLATGAICNFLVVVSNGGFMPTSPEALQHAGLLEAAQRLIEDGAYANLVLMSQHTHLNALGDILYLPKWIPFSAAFSIGDLVIVVALTWLIVKGMRIDAKRTVATS